jgi:hypothetical protein
MANQRNVKTQRNKKKNTQSQQMDGPKTIKGRLSRMEKLVAKRTAELKKVNDSLKK